MNQVIKIIQDKMEKISEQEKIFRELGDNDYADNNAMVNIMLEGIINEISSLPSDTQWIDVKNGNPKGFCNYIVTNGKSSFEAWYSDVDNIFKHIDDSGNCKGITHYMEFPNPPKG